MDRILFFDRIRVFFYIYFFLTLSWDFFGTFCIFFYFFLVCVNLSVSNKYYSISFSRKVSETHSTKRLLNLIDVSIFDFLIQNGDRHRYEVYKDKIILLDNGKGLGNPMVDELDILAPLYQCCM